MFDVTSGVPQGSVHDTLWLFICINLIVEKVQDIGLYIFMGNLKSKRKSHQMRRKMNHTKRCKIGRNTCN